MIISGATGMNSGEVNGIYLSQNAKSDRLFYKNLVNQCLLFYAPNGQWQISSNEDLESNKAWVWCRSDESGLGHPSRARLWQVRVGGKWNNQWAEQSVLKVVTTVRRKTNTRFISFY